MEFQIFEYDLKRINEFYENLPNDFYRVSYLKWLQIRLKMLKYAFGMEGFINYRDRYEDKYYTIAFNVKDKITEIDFLIDNLKTNMELQKLNRDLTANEDVLPEQNVSNPNYEHGDKVEYLRELIEKSNLVDKDPKFAKKVDSIYRKMKSKFHEMTKDNVRVSINHEGLYSGRRRMK